MKLITYQLLMKADRQLVKEIAELHKSERQQQDTTTLADIDTDIRVKYEMLANVGRLIEAMDAGYLSVSLRIPDAAIEEYQ